MLKRIGVWTPRRLSNIAPLNFLAENQSFRGLASLIYDTSLSAEAMLQQRVQLE